MKKFVVGVVCGALLVTGVSAVSAEIKNALIGKKVAGTMSVSIDGKTVDKDAVIIESTSYLPVRSITEAIGGKITSVKDGEIKLTTQVVEEFDEEKAIKEIQIKGKIAAAKSQIEQIERRRDLAQAEIDNGKDLIKADGGTIPFKESDVYARFTAEIEEANAEIAELEAEIAELEAELAALEAE